jgi:hypothetical protein
MAIRSYCSRSPNYPGVLFGLTSEWAFGLPVSVSVSPGHWLQHVDPVLVAHDVGFAVCICASDHEDFLVANRHRDAGEFNLLAENNGQRAFAFQTESAQTDVVPRIRVGCAKWNSHDREQEDG